MAQQTIPVNDGYISSHVGTTPSTGPFAVDFPFFSLADVSVSRKADGTEIDQLLIRGADYDLVGVGTDDGSFSSGTVTLYLAVSNTTVTRFRVTPVERLSNFPLQGFFSRLSLNAELNRITVWMQELHGLLGTTSEASQAHAPIVSPTFVGDPKAPTPPFADNDTSIATTAFVQAALAGVSAAVPSGVIVDYAGAVAPAGWLLCAGQTVNRVTYAGLFTAIGTTYNVGGEAGTDFRLPDLRGRVVAGKDNMNGVAANRLTAAGAGVNGSVLGAAGGHEMMQQHTHTVTDPSHSHIMTFSNPAGLNTGQVGYGNGANAETHSTNAAATGISIQNAGTGTGQNLQPTFVTNKIVKT